MSMVPIKRLRDWDTVKDFSQVIVEHLAKAILPRFVAKSGPSNRVGRIFIDYLRNSSLLTLPRPCPPRSGGVRTPDMGRTGGASQRGPLDCFQYP